MSLTSLTIDGSEFMSYASVDEADVLMAISPQRNEAWRALTGEAGLRIKRIELVAATRLINSLGTFKGRRTDPNQPLPLPREDLIVDGVTLPSDKIPPAVEEGTILLAGSTNLYPEHRQVSTGVTQRVIQSVKTGDEEITYDTGSHIITVDSRAIKDEEVINLLNPLFTTPIVHQPHDLPAPADEVPVVGSAGGLSNRVFGG